MNFLKQLDYPVFLGSAGILIVLSAGIALFGDSIDVAGLKLLITENIGSAFLTVGILSLFYVLFIACSKIGDIVLTGSDAGGETLSTTQWIARLFCGGIGASILFWAMTEWIFYLQTPPFQSAADAKEALEWASTYGMFHWGPIAWAMYLVPTIPIAYVYHVRKVKVLKLSTALAPAIGEDRAQGWMGKTIDIFFLVGVVAGGATGLGVKGPLMAEGVGWMFDFIPTSTSSILTIAACALFFLVLFLKFPSKGTTFLASTAFYGTFVIFAAFLIFGPASFMFSHGLESIGRILDNFFSMATYSQAADGRLGLEVNHFPQNWTVFYWAWWLVFAPAMGLYLAKISQGKTIRQLILGTLVFGSLGACAFFVILGNYGIDLYLKGVVDLPEILDSVNPSAAVLAALDKMPMAAFVIVVYVGVVAFYTAAGLESFSFMLGAVSQKTVGSEGVRLPLRIFWTVLLITLASLMIHIGGIEILQLVTITCAIPMLVITVLVAWAGWRIATLDLEHHDPDDVAKIELEEFPEIDPWSEEGKAWQKFESLVEESTALAENEQKMVDAIAANKKQLQADDLDDATRVKLSGAVEGLQVQWTECRKRRAELQEEIDALYAECQSLRRKREEKELLAQHAEIKEAYLKRLEEQSPIQNKALQEKLADLKTTQVIGISPEEIEKESQENKSDKSEKAENKVEKN